MKEKFYYNKLKRDVYTESVFDTYEPAFTITYDMVKDMLAAGLEFNVVIFSIDGTPVVYSLWAGSKTDVFGWKMEFTKESHYIGLRYLTFDESVDKDLREALRDAKNNPYVRVYLTTNEVSGIENRLWDYINKHSQYDDVSARNVAEVLGYKREDIKEVAFDKTNPVYYIVDPHTKAINYVAGVQDFIPFMYTWYMDDFIHKIWLNTPDEAETVADIKARVLNDDYSIQPHITF